MAPINTLGYGYVGLNLAMHLDNMRNNVSLFPIGNIEAEPQYHELIRKLISNQGNFNKHAPTLRVFHQFSMAESVGYGDRLGWPIFELNKFNDTEWHHLSSLDTIIVCSKWAHDIVRDNKINVSCGVVPLGVDDKVFRPMENVQRDSNTTFFNCGKWEIRKGHDILIEAFLKAFEPTDNVRLVMHCFNPFDDNNKWIDLYKNNKMSDKIVISDNRNIPQQMIAQMMNYADCCVFPSRAEGWNMELLESMACGRQCIATNYSAHTEYATKENCMLIDVDGTEMAYDGRFFFGEGEWAEMGQRQVDQLIEYMRAVHKEKQEYGNCAQNLPGIETAKKLNWGETCLALMLELSR